MFNEINSHLYFSFDLFKKKKSTTVPYFSIFTEMDPQPNLILALSID